MIAFIKKKNGTVIKSSNKKDKQHFSYFKSLYGKLTKEQQKSKLQQIIYDCMVKEDFFKYKLTMYKIMKKFGYESINQISNIINMPESVKYFPNQNGILRNKSDAVHEIF